MVKVKSLGFGILVLLLMVNTCSAGFSLLVSPVDTKIVSPGESISYKAIVNDDLLFIPETVIFSINRTAECPSWIDEDYWSPGWDYTFNPSNVILENPTDSKFTILTLKVPADAAPGYYYHPVEVTVSNFFGVVIAQVYVTDTDVTNVPEFPTIAVPVIAVLGLVTMFGRRNNKD